MIREWFRFDKFLSGQQISDTDVERILRFELPLPGFRSLPLFDGLTETEMQVNEIKKKIKQHARMVRVVKGERLIEAGTYTNTVFFVIEGTASVHKPIKKRPWILEKVFARGEEEDSYDDEAVTVEKGHLLGLSGTLDRVRQIADVTADSDMILLEMRWQLVYQIVCSSRDFSNYVEYNFRQQAMYYYLSSQLWFQHIPARDLRLIVDNTDFKSHGSSNWFRAKHDSEVIIEQGDRIDQLLIVWAGFASIVRKTHHGQELLRMMRRHSNFGMQAIYKAAQNESDEELQQWQKCVQALGYAKVLTVPRKLIEELVLPTLPKKLKNRLDKDRRNTRLTFLAEKQSADKFNLEMSFQAGTMEFIEEGAYLNGNHGMIINLDRCTRCFDCMTACANLHEGNAVFSWHGKRFDNFQISNACMHCVDPVCMVECPTGAISRSGDMEDVQINQDTCIGCGACAEACPYNNISMLELTKPVEGGAPGEVEVERQVASKCDLCAAESHGPACQNACPQEALLRVNMLDMNTITKWVRR